MPYPRQTLATLIQQVHADIKSSLPGADPLLRFSILNILGKAVAGLAYGHYGYQDWIAKQSNPYTATGENLEAWAALKAVVRLAPIAAAGAVTFAGSPGAVIPAGTRLVRGDGIEYATNDEATIGGGGTVVAAVTATRADVAGNALAGTVLSLGSGIDFVQSKAEVTTAIAGGADQEDDDSLRTRMLAAYSKPPQGGSKTDYEQWARAVAGVTRAWCEPNGMGSGTVIVRFMMDETQAENDGFPQGDDGVASDETRATTATGDQLAVADHIFPLQPVGALVYAVAPLANPIDFTLTGTATWSADLKAAVEEAIAAALIQNGAPGGAVLLSYIEAAIAAVAGTAGFVITAPSGNVAQSAGELPTLGDVTFT